MLTHHFFVDLFLTINLHYAMSLWYVDEQLNISEECSHACETTLDCPLEMSCFQALKDKHGCCMAVLRPNETGCVINEQCTRACSTSYCSQNVQPSRCLCQPDYHFLFGKCWKHCPPFAIKQAPLFHDDPSTTQCLLNRDHLSVEMSLDNRPVRKRRQLQRNSYC